MADVDEKLQALVEFIIQDGTQNTSSGNWMIYFAELQTHSGLCIEGYPFIQQQIECMLRRRPEVAELYMEEDGFDVTYYLDYCKEFQKEGEQESDGLMSIWIEL